MGRKLSEYQEEEIIKKYVSGIHATALAQEYGVTARSIQRLCNKHGVIRTQSESYILAIKQGRMKYYKKPDHLKVNRKGITLAKRHEVLIRDRYKCRMCNMSREDGVKLTVDHVNEDSRDNRLSNLQTLCQDCNQGKWQNSDKYKELQKSRQEFFKDTPEQWEARDNISKLANSDRDPNV